MVFSQAENIIQATFRSAMREAETQRKRETVRMLDYFHATQTPYIQEQIARERQEPERYHPVFFNVVGKIVRGLSQVYLADATRDILNGTDQDKAIYAAIETTAQLPAKMKQTNRFTTLCGNVLLRPVWRNGKMDLDVLTGDVLDVFYGDSPETLDAVMITHDETGRADEVEYDLWTPETYSRLDSQGNTLKTEPNLYGVLPFVPVFSSPPTNEFWLQGAADLMAVQDEVNRRLTNLSFTADLQGFGVAVAKGITPGRDGKPPDLTFGPGNFLGLPEGADFNFAAPNAPIQDILAMIDFLLKQAAITRGLTAASMATNTSQESGVARLAGNVELEEARRDQIANFAGVEAKLFELFRIIWNVHNPHRQMSEAATLRVEFYDPKPVISPLEQVQTWEKQLELGLTTREDILIELNPDLTRKEAEQRLEEIHAKNQKYGGNDHFGYTPSFDSFPNDNPNPSPNSA